MGRKKVETAEKVDVRLRMDADFQKQIQEAADQERISVAAFIRSVVAKELQRRKRGGGE